MSVDPAQRLLAYSVDNDGGERFSLRFRQMDQGVDLPDVIEGTYYGGAWSADSEWFFYTTIDHAHRPFRAWRHRLGTPQSSDLLVYEETDERFYLEVDSTRDDRYVRIFLESSTTAEVRYVPTALPESEPAVLLPRITGVRYEAEHRDGRWLVVTDEQAPNGRLISVDPADISQQVELIAHDPAAKVGAAIPFSDHIVVTGRRQGNPALIVLHADGQQKEVLFQDAAYRLGPADNLEYETANFRFTYESMLTPRRVIDLNLGTGEQTLVKETQIPRGYQPSDYEQRRLWVQKGDVQIPVTIACRRGTQLPAPTLVYGYGAYESVLDPWFDPPDFSLLDRGVVYAIAHVRGGGEMGRLWHLDGRMENKQHTFSDFIAVTEFLIDEGIAQAGRIAARGISAGGLLMGVVTTARPDLWAAVVAEVPFVDVINTMLDPSIPLTVNEWEEWGNPALPDQHQWMLAYSPYEHTGPADYPAVLATAGLQDPRVAYWEPAKWVAKLREANTGSRPILLRTELGAGHGGPSGRYDSWRKEAFVLAFILDQLGIAG
jgi:oligopeptidase B